MTTEADPAPARWITRRRLMLVLGAAILGTCAWLAVSRIRAPAALTSPTIPNPNGYDDVLQAGRAIQDARLDIAGLDVAAADEATLSTLVEASRDALVTARRGLDRPFQVPVVYDLNDLSNRLMNEIGLIRGLARALAAEGRLAERQGRIDDAVRADFDLVRLGDAMSHRVPMLPYQVSLAIQRMGCEGLRDLRTKLSADQCRRVIGGLQDQDRNREPVADVIRQEHRFMDANLNKMGLAAKLSFSLGGMLNKEKANVASLLARNERQADTGRRLVLADLAVRLHRLENGESPPTLDALVPAILKSVPLDPYSGKPLIYRKLAQGDQLYSVGPDGDDDRLEPALGKRHLDSSNGDFTLDSF
jgi:hypothetical protein